MNWTKEPPKEPGWYWYKAPEHKVWVVEVIEVCVRNTHSGRMRARFEWGWMDISSTNKFSEWAGPIPEPEEAE